jgi:acetylornithine deacetylase/succinyl-diaminopimelate desuccinylase-like protein
MENNIDWNQVRVEVTGYLQDLIRINTTNPPGNETAAAAYIAEVLNREGYETILTESAPGRGNVTTRLAGGNEDSLLLLGHTDVVDVDAAHWTHPPFSGVLVDDFIWGRGALDMKNMVAAELMVMLLLKRIDARPDRDVMYAATADEEAGKGGHGPGWLLDNHPEQIEAPVILTEGGGHDVIIGDRRFTTCQVGQKGICRLKVTARGRPGHGSVPHADDAVLALCAALAPLQEADLPLHPSATMRAFIEGVSAGQPQALAADLLAVLDPVQSDAALARLPIDPDTQAQWRSLLRNTASVTMLEAGTKINVIPAEASAWIDGRLAPGATQESFLVELRGIIGEDLDFEVDQYNPPLEAQAEGGLYDVIVDVMRDHDPKAPVVSSLSTGGTDAKHIVPRRPATQVYGFMPYRQQPGLEEMQLIHGHDERTSVDELLFATRVLFDIVVHYTDCGGEKS